MRAPSPTPHQGRAGVPARSTGAPGPCSGPAGRLPAAPAWPEGKRTPSPQQASTSCDAAISGVRVPQKPNSVDFLQLLLAFEGWAFPPEATTLT
ncbi:hypothetical protein A6R68_05379 [Neotoma lepida]|uniref:Uncharacterized protein n=1 Tax=Neotoma lepida TaxID=56216 RepID=A0A1A6GIN7_NEOLE|nr:hypothetical protein A6R68_05379 [Neotoma lepida]